MNRASIGLAIVGSVVFLMLTFAGVFFVAGAVFFALAAYLSPWLAALLTAGVLLLPLLVSVSWLGWSAYQRRLRKRRRFEAVKTAIAASAVNDPFGFVCTAFLTGMTLSKTPVTAERVAEFVAAVRKT